MRAVVSSQTVLDPEREIWLARYTHPPRRQVTAEGRCGELLALSQLRLMRKRDERVGGDVRATTKY